MTARRDRHADDLVFSMYDAAFDPLLWPDVLDRCAEIAGAKSCSIFEYAENLPKRPFLITHMCGSFSERAMDDYVHDNLQQEIADRSVAKSIISMKDDIEALSDEPVYDDYDEFLSRPNVRSLMEIGLRHRVIAFLNKDNLNVGQFTLQYPDGRGPALAEELSVLNKVLPHLAKAIDLSRPTQHLATHRLQLMAAMDRLALGICVLDAKGRIVQENEEFRRQRKENGVFVKTPGGALQFSRDADQKRFEELKSDVRNHGQFGARPRKEVISNRNGEHLCIELQHLNKAEEIGSGEFAGYVLHSLDTTKPVSLDPYPVQKIFGLTQAETALVLQLAEGLTNTQIAERNNRAVATIRNQVNAILTKTGCSTRTQFIRLLMSFGANYLAED